MTSWSLVCQIAVVPLGWQKQLDLRGN